MVFFHLIHLSFKVVTVRSFNDKKSVSILNFCDKKLGVGLTFASVTVKQETEIENCHGPHISHFGIHVGPTKITEVGLFYFTTCTYNVSMVKSQSCKRNPSIVSFEGDAPMVGYTL